jgi:protein gp37
MISWTSKVWNCVLGCSRDNEECDHCYAMFVAHRGMDPSHRGLTKLRPKDSARPGVDWNGTIRTLPERLGKPLSWKKPHKVFVNSMSDLFHPSVPFEFVAAVFGVMAATPRHTYQVLTKRPKRAREFFESLKDKAARRLAMAPPRDTPWQLSPLDICVQEARAVDALTASQMGPGYAQSWPLPNVHLGVSAGRQDTAEEKISVLLDCPAAVHWVSIEPMLGPVDLEHLKVEGGVLDALRGLVTVDEEKGYVTPNRLRWIVVGGESGPGARTCDLSWIRGVLSQCAAAGVPAFSKQVGSNPVFTDGDGSIKRFPILDSKGEDWRV